MLHACSDHLEENNAHQAMAVIGISLIAMGEELGSEMALRTFDHLLQYLEFHSCYFGYNNNNKDYFYYDVDMESQ